MTTLIFRHALHQALHWLHNSTHCVLMRTHNGLFLLQGNIRPMSASMLDKGSCEKLYGCVSLFLLLAPNLPQCLVNTQPLLDQPHASAFSSLSHAGLEPLSAFHPNLSICLLCFRQFISPSAVVRRESHRLSSSSDLRMQRSYVQQHSPRGSPDNMFGVRVQVQGIKGQPYVVLNSSDEGSLRDISVITHQPGYNPGMVRRSADGRHSPAETQKAALSSELHYQKHPEILKPYDPNSNNLSVIIPQPTPLMSRPGPEPTKPANLSKPRIPLPAEGPETDQVEVLQTKAPHTIGHIPARAPNSVETESTLSVGRLISQFNNSQRRGRGCPRNRLDAELCRRSRSLDSRASDTSSTSSSFSNRALSLKATRAPETSAGIILTRSVESQPNNKLSKLLTIQNGNLHHPERTLVDQTDGSGERDTQVMTFASKCF